MMLKSGFLEDDRCMVTDYGTNAEMALKVGDDIYTGSAAAGPALEGQQISAGMLASPGAISDLVRCPEGWREKVLDERLDPQDGGLVNLRSGILKSRGATVKGITGTGVIALIYAGMRDDRIVPPAIARGDIMLARGIRFTERDLVEAGKAIGAIRAGHMTLMAEAGIGPEDLGNMLNGTPADVTRESLACIEKAGLNGGFILAPGCDTPRDCADANLIAMGNAAVDFWKGRK